MQYELFEESAFFDEEGDTKQCSKCSEVLPVSCFSWHSGANYLRPECKSCNNELSKIRDSLRRKYGMPNEGYICPICLEGEEAVSGKGNNKNGAWVIDHCHDTDTFRGWLCHKCNRSIGGFSDSIDVLQRAIQYLKGTGNENNT